MKIDQLASLQQLTDLAYQRDLAELAPILEREKQLRTQLSSLEEKAKQGRQTESALELMRPMGADILWERWLARHRRDINSQLAQVLAEKERRVSSLRKSFGRSRVTTEVAKQEEAKKTRQREKKRQAAILERLAKR